MNDQRGAVPLAGRTILTPRALRGLAMAVSAEALGVPRSAVAVRLSDESGDLAVSVSGAIRVNPLTSGTHPGAPRGFGTMEARAIAAQDTIALRIAELAGRTLARVDLTVTSAHIQARRRVQ